MDISHSHTHTHTLIYTKRERERHIHTANTQIEKEIKSALERDGRVLSKKERESEIARGAIGLQVYIVQEYIPI